MFFLATNYHYIGNENAYPYSGIYPISKDRLKQQLQELGRVFEFIGQRELLDALSRSVVLPQKCCLVTFDDGLMCQWEEAVGVLQELSIPAIFFVGGKPLKERKTFLVHKIHWVRAHTPAQKFLEDVAHLYERFTGKSFALDELAGVFQRDSVYRYDTDVEAKVKLVLNKLLQPKVRERIVDALFAQLVSDEVAFCERFYMQREQLAEVYRRGWLGIHSYSHPYLSSLPLKGVAKEFSECVAALKQFVDPGLVVYGVSYPYGSPEAVSQEVAKVAGEAGLHFGFTMERSFNRTLQQPLLFARIDTNDAPGGKQPLFQIQNGEIVLTEGGMNDRRSLYTLETVA